MFCETSDQYLVAYIITAWVIVARYEIQNIGYLKCFVSSLELKMDVLYTRIRVLPTNSTYTTHIK